MSPELPWMRAGLLHATEKRWTKKNVETILQSNSSTAGVFKFPCNHQLIMIHIDTALMLQVSVWPIDLSYVYIWARVARSWPPPPHPHGMVPPPYPAPYPTVLAATVVVLVLVLPITSTT